MPFAPQIAEQVARLPAGLRIILDREVAAGNTVVEVDIDRISESGEKVALRFQNPFHTDPGTLPNDVSYMELEYPRYWVFQFSTQKERFFLITIKTKLMILPKLAEGPPDPTAAYIARMEEIEKRDAARAAEPAVEDIHPRDPLPTPGFGEAANGFIASMKITYEMWHDGAGYDLAALRTVSLHERDAIEAILIRHDPRDWRDIEALAEIDSPRASEAIQKALKSADADVRREAMKHFPAQADSVDRERLLIHTLNTANLFGGLSTAIDEAAEFHPPAVIAALLRGAHEREGEVAVHFAALLMYVHGKAAEPFDWNHRPFFLLFNAADPADREAAFRELCETIGVQATPYLKS